MTRALAAIVALAALATVVVGCGGDDEEEAVLTPAAIVPASSLVYADAVLRPEGAQRTAIEAPLTALLGTEDPGQILIEELDRSLAAEDPPLTYAEDVEPWLGERGALFYSKVLAAAADGGDVENPFLDEGFEGAFVFDVTDADAAEAFIDELGGGEEDSVDAQLVGDSLVVGTPRGVEEVEATEAGGDSLADDPGYGEAMGGDVGQSATLYVDIPAIAEAAGDAGEIEAADREALDKVFAGLADEPLTAVVAAETTGIGFEVSHGASDIPLLSAASEPAILRDLPADSWLAAGFAEAGETIGAFVESARDLGVAEEEVESTRERFRSEYGLELEELYGPLGDGALFAGGEGIFGFGGGIVFETSDPAAAEKLVGGLERAAKRGGEEIRRLSGEGGATGFSIDVPDLPGALNFVAGEDRIVVAYGEAATVAALDPEETEGTLGESESFTAAESKLGDGYDVSAFVDFAPIADLLSLAAATDQALQRALPYLEALDFMVAGTSTEGERERQRLYLGISGITEEPSA